MMIPGLEKNFSKDSSGLPDINEMLRWVQDDFDSESQPFEPVELIKSEQQLEPYSETQYIQAAAVLNSFEPETIKPQTVSQNPVNESDYKDRNKNIKFLLGCSAMVVKPGETDVQPRWSLRDSIRRETLAELAAADRINEALNANPQIAFDETDSVQQILTAVLRRELPPLRELRLDQLIALQRIEPWISELNLISDGDNLNSQHAFNPSESLRHYIERERLLEPFRHLVGRWENGAFTEHFRGRKNELERLRKYVNVAESQSYFEATTRAIDSLKSYLFNLHERPPLVIHGPGGVGKSTLMAKFILQHAEARERQQFPFIYADFDHPDIGSGSLESLLIKISGQLASQFPSSAHKFTDFQRRVREDAAYDKSINFDHRLIAQNYTALLKSIYNEAVGQQLPLLLVLDTFEEIQQRSREQVRAIFEFLGWLQGVVPRLRAVIAGRAPVSEEEAGVKVENLELPDLDVEAAIGFLESRGIRDEQVCREIVELAGRHPLALKLAADLAQEHGLTEIREAAGGSGIFARLRRAWTTTDITGRLYERLLNHIADAEIRKLAHPGLVLRRITPEIIRDVLAAPCKVEIATDEDAQQLFERLRVQVSLVSPAEPGVLRHRPDVRRIMLPLILEDDAFKESARQIQQKAVAFYEHRRGTAARAEEIYHRLLLGESPRAVESRWTQGLEAHFNSDTLDELPSTAQAFVAARTDAERNDAVWAAAELADWELYAERRARRLLNKNEPERALNVIRQRSERTGGSRLLALEAIVLAAAGRHEESDSAAQRAFEQCFANGKNQDLYQELSELSIGKAGAEIDDEQSDLYDDWRKPRLKSRKKK